MKMEDKVFRNVPDNEQSFSPSFTMSPWLVKKACIQGDPGGKQSCFRKNYEERPTSIPCCLHEGGWGGPAPSPEGIEDRLQETKTDTKPVSIHWDCEKCGKYFRYMDVTQPKYISPSGSRGGRRKLEPEQLLILVTLLKKH